MTALALARQNKTFTASEMQLPATAATVYHGGIACWDTSSGRVVKGAASTTLIPIGIFYYPTEQSHTVANNGDLVQVKLFRELRAIWMANDGTVVAANLGSLAFLVDDQTVANNSNSNARRPLGRIWKLDTILGVLVEPLTPASEFIVNVPATD